MSDYRNVNELKNNQKRQYTFIRISILSLLSLALFSCSTRINTVDPNPSRHNQSLVGTGASGMAQVNDSTFITVFDKKNHEEGVRVALLVVSQAKLEGFPIRIDYWGEEGQSSDLEGICGIPNRENEFLLLESGNWEGKFGRIFHIRLDTQKLEAKVLGSSTIPINKINDRNNNGDQYEALYCFPSNDNQALIILGERGDSKANIPSLLKWGTLNFDQYQFSFTNTGLQGIQVNAPGDWNNRPKRGISDFYLDQENYLWASAASDPGDFGPFYSVIYRIGKLNEQKSSTPVDIETGRPIYTEINGFKVEALSGPVSGTNSTHSIGTEDEDFGGIWRPIQIDSNKQ